MTIKLSPELEEYVNEQVDKGEYPDAETVVADALLRMRLESMPLPDNPRPLGPFDHPWTKEKLRAAIQRGIDQADRGELAKWDVEELKRRVHERLAREQDE